MAQHEQHGVAFPRDDRGSGGGPGEGTDGGRSTSSFGRAVVEAALRDIDPVGARAAAQETNWRSGYLTHFRRLVEAGVGNPDGARRAALAGVDEIAARMRWVTSDGEDLPLSSYDAQPVVEVTTETVTGSGEPVAELAIPYRGERLTGDALLRRLDQWVAAGVMEPSAATSVRTVAEHPEWLSLPGRTVVALGAGAEIGAASTLLDWGATVAGIDLRRADLWRRVLDQAAASAGTLVVPAVPGTGDLHTRAGLDLLHELPTVLQWTSSLGGPLVLGSYLYADGGTNVRLSVAGDALATSLQARRDDVTLAFLATPTDVFAVPAEAVEHSVAAYEARSLLAKIPGRGLRAVSGGKLLQRAYRPGVDPGICDSLVPQQGPNYALGKRMQRWRATAERAAGRTVSMNVAPPTRTRSVVKNRALAAAYAGAHRFGAEAFDPATTRVLMAALLVHDLHVPAPTFAEPWQEEAHQAVHGGLWRTGYAPRSALGLAALLGFGSTRA
ncbi:MAG: hypothetical protein U0R78_09030 [Nocardioidaceae bacterium]